MPRVADLDLSVFKSRWVTFSTSTINRYYSIPFAPKIQTLTIVIA
jgi:hypothetical protein